MIISLLLLPLALANPFRPTYFLGPRNELNEVLPEAGDQEPQFVPRLQQGLGDVVGDVVGVAGPVVVTGALTGALGPVGTLIAPSVTGALKDVLGGGNGGGSGGSSSSKPKFVFNFNFGKNVANFESAVGSGSALSGNATSTAPAPGLENPLAPILPPSNVDAAVAAATTTVPSTTTTRKPTTTTVVCVDKMATECPPMASYCLNPEYKVMMAANCAMTCSDCGANPNKQAGNIAVSGRRRRAADQDAVDATPEMFFPSPVIQHDLLGGIVDVATGVATGNVGSVIGGAKDLLGGGSSSSGGSSSGGPMSAAGGTANFGSQDGQFIFNFNFDTDI